jgi:two-component system NtrC family sensor kinase
MKDADPVPSRADDPARAARPKSTFSLGLPARLGILTALLAMGLVLGGSQIALSWSEREHIQADRREAASLAQTLASYLVSVAPTGQPDSLRRAFSTWAESDISGATAWVYVFSRGRLVPLMVDSTTDAPPPDDLVITAPGRRRPAVAFAPEPDPAWHVAVALGEHPYGVLSMWVPTQRLERLAAQRRRTLLLAVASALLVALSVAGLTARWVGRPLNELGQAMTRAGGTAGQAPEAPEIGPREFQLLARRYNDMQRALAARERESTARAALLALEERARSYDRLAVTAETSAELAHEIGTPLSTIRGHVQLLRDDLLALGHAAPLDRINALLAQLDRVTTIVRGALERGAWPAPAVQPVDLEELAARLLQFMAPTLEAAGVRAVLRRDRSSEGRRCLAWADPAFVEQILLNLIKNAIEALQPGGHIETTVGADGEGAYVVVSDDGPGLSPDMQAYLFKPFVTTKGPGGTGLGLTISRRLARTLGGELQYVPSDRGTRWRLTLPLAPESRRATSPAASEISAS